MKIPVYKHSVSPRIKPTNISSSPVEKLFLYKNNINSGDLNQIRSYYIHDDDKCYICKSRASDVVIKYSDDKIINIYPTCSRQHSSLIKYKFNI